MHQEIENFGNWLRRKSQHTTTHRHYTSDLTLFFAWAGKSPAEITLSDVDDYIAYAQEQGHAVATINRRLAALSAFYQFLQLHLSTPPANPVLPRRHFSRQGRRLPRDVDEVRLDRLLAVITSPRDRAMFLLMLRCGLRVGEVHWLSLPDLDLQPTSGRLPRLYVTGKGGKQRVAYLSPQVVSALESWLVDRPSTPEPAVFLNRSGHRLSVAGIQKRLAGYCRQAGLSLTCHQLRHTFGRHLTEAQVPVTTIQRLLGHAQLQTTQLYTHLSNHQARAEYEAAIAGVTDLFDLGGGV
jgi:site-specific recombinase XerC